MKKMLFLMSAASVLALSGAAFAAGASPSPQAHTVRTVTHSDRDATRALYRDAQTKLKADHLYNGPINGRINDATTLAIRNFQARNDLVQTGRLDGPTRHALGV